MGQKSRSNEINQKTQRKSHVNPNHDPDSRGAVGRDCYAVMADDYAEIGCRFGQLWDTLQHGRLSLHRGPEGLCYSWFVTVDGVHMSFGAHFEDLNDPEQVAREWITVSQQPSRAES